MKSTTLLLVLLAFAAGGVVGGFVSHRSQAVPPTVSDSAVLTARLAADTSLNIAYLYRLRDGKLDEVRSLLEMQAD